MMDALIDRYATNILTTSEDSKIDKWRDTHIYYTESSGDAYKSISIETHLTHDELIVLVRELMGDAR